MSSLQQLYYTIIAILSTKKAPKDAFFLNM